MEVKVGPGAGAPGSYTSPAPEASKHAESGHGSVSYVAAQNTNAAKRYLFVFDGGDQNGTLIHAPIPVEAHGVGGFDLAYGIEFKKGLFIALSTNDAAFAAAGADGWFTALWRGL